MNKDEVIALAEKCKLAVLIHSQWTHEIREFTVVDYVVEGDLGSLMQFADLVANAEREACAKVCDEFPDVGYIDKKLTSDYHAHLIRQRGQA